MIPLSKRSATALLAGAGLLFLRQAAPLEGDTYGPALKIPMTKGQSKSQPTWTDVKAKLAAFDRTALPDLLHHLYVAHKDNQAFLHARFALGEDVLEPYKL